MNESQKFFGKTADGQDVLSDDIELLRITSWVSSWIVVPFIVMGRLRAKQV